MGYLTAKQPDRDDADHSASSTQRRVRQLTHETDAAAAVDHADVPAGKQHSEVTGGLLETHVSGCRRPAEHAHRSEDSGHAGDGEGLAGEVPL
jgi:hypothetical protein